MEEEIDSREPNERVKKKHEAFIHIFENSLGNISTACEKIGMSRGNFYVWMNAYPLFKERINEISESLLDFTETQLLLNIKDRKEASIFFMLKTKGKSRGYIERTEVIEKQVSRFDDLSDDELDKQIDKILGEQK